MEEETYLDATEFAIFGIPDPRKWVDELRAAADDASLKGVC